CQLDARHNIRMADSLKEEWAMAIPTTNGQLVDYHAVEPPNATPRIYYVNGIQTDGKTHAMTAMALSILTERVIHGIYNATAGLGAGIILDLLQCGADWTDIFLSKLAWIGYIRVHATLEKVMSLVRGKAGQSQANPINVAESIRRRIPAAYRVAFIERCLSTYNKATAALFQQLRNHQTEKQLIIAHSQGNLIVADALWSMVIAF